MKIPSSDISKIAWRRRAWGPVVASCNECSEVSETSGCSTSSTECIEVFSRGVSLFPRSIFRSHQGEASAPVDCCRAYYRLNFAYFKLFYTKSFIFSPCYGRRRSVIVKAEETFNRDN